MAKNQQAEIEISRRTKKERRGEERRKQDVPVATERRQLERRTKVQRRRQIDPTTCEREYNDEEIQFMQALEAYKRANGRMFPTCSEILEVVRGLGYVLVSPNSQNTMPGAEPTILPPPNQATDQPQIPAL
ncbi:MAG TPA: hypothetical protein VGI40_28100 [Pirellulaceae bacterium]|jgi:hypothetical protein